MRCVAVLVSSVMFTLTNAAQADDSTHAVSACMQGSIIDIAAGADQEQMDLLLSSVVTVMDQANAATDGPDAELIAYYGQQLTQLRSGALQAIPLATDDGPVLHWTDFHNTSHCMLPSSEIADDAGQLGLLTLANTSDETGDWPHIILVRGAAE